MNFGKTYFLRKILYKILGLVLLGNCDKAAAQYTSEPGDMNYSLLPSEIAAPSKGGLPVLDGRTFYGWGYVDRKGKLVIKPFSGKEYLHPADVEEYNRSNPYRSEAYMFSRIG